VSTCFCVVLSCVSVEALCWTDPPTKESYQMSVDREGQGPIRTVEASWGKKSLYIAGMSGARIAQWYSAGLRAG
jgi:hypothetical protein